MKQYVIDQLRLEDFEKIMKFLDEHAEATSIEGVYRLYLPDEILAEPQREHPECRPFYFPVTLTVRDVSFELLVRSFQIIRCSCIAYADARQREFLIDFADRMLTGLDINV